MTTIYEAARTGGGRLHAFVIGVDQYPFCGRRTRLESPWHDLARAVHPLSCATPSALAIVDWLHRHRDDRMHPLGSIELLLSDDTEQKVDGQPIEKAAMPNVKRAFERWYDRCDRSPDDVALFYFCGHGLRVGSEDILLLEDFGESRHTVFGNAIDFRTTYYGMRMAEAGIQCFIVDACRNVPGELLGKEGAGATVLKEPAPTLDLRDAPIVYSALPGDRALATVRAPTGFTTAVIQALEGGAAESPGADWIVTTSMLAARTNSLLLWDAGDDDGPWAVAGGQALGGTIHVIDRPQVPFRFGCDPHAALPGARLSLANGAHAFHRAPAETLWCDAAPASSYALRAHFEAQDYAGETTEILMVPPYKDYRLPVRPT